MKKLAFLFLSACATAFGSSAQVVQRLHYDFNNVTGTTVADLSGNGLTGRVTGCTSVAGCSGVPNTALHFGTGQLVSSPASPLLNLTTWTISALVKVDNFNIDPTDCQVSKILQHGSQYTSNYYALELNDNGYEQDQGNQNPCGTSTPGAQQFSAAAANSIPSGANYAGNYLSTGTWYCLTATYDDATMRYYINGTLVHAFPWTQGYAYNPSNSPVSVLIGSGTGQGGSTYWFDGDIDDIQVFSGAMPASQVATLCPSCNPVAPCSVDDISYCSKLSTPFTYTFTATSNPSGNCVEWNFGDGTPPVTSGPGAPVTHTFPPGGNFTICATGFDCRTQVRCPNPTCFSMCIDPSSGARPANTAAPTKVKNPLGASVGEPFPNPTSSTLTVPVRGLTGKTVISVYGVQGAVLSKQEVELNALDQQVKINTAALRPGSYVVEIVSNGEAVRKRFTKL